MKKMIIKILSYFIFPRMRAKEFRHAFLHFGKGSLKIIGKNNKIILIKDNQEIPLRWPLAGLDLVVEGNNNTIKIGHPWHFENTTIKLTKNNNFFEIKSCPMGVKNTLFEISGRGKGSKVRIGKNFGISGSHYSSHSQFCINGDLTIGDNVLFAANNIVRTSDSHVIYDINTNEIKNYEKPIVIGNHVWICEGCAILKGTVINDNSVIGTKSVVNKEFNEENIIIAGVPAKIIKKNINWDVMGINEFLENYPNTYSSNLKK